MNLYDLLGDYARRRRLCRKTISVYRTALRQLTACLGHLPSLDDFTDDLLLDFEAWLDNGRAPFTIRERVGKIRSLWRFASDRGLIATRPTVSPPPAVAQERPKAWTVDELSRLLRACDIMPGEVAGIPAAAYWRSWLVICYATGERAGALQRLTWDCVTLSGPRPQIDVPAATRKNQKAVAPYDLPVWAVEALVAIAEPARELVWPWEQSRATWYHRYNWLLQKAGLPHGRRHQSQKLRRTHLTLWQASGGDASQRAAHSSRSITEAYYLDQTMLPRDNPETRLPRIS